MKRTKTKLLSSIAVLIVCFAMLIGSTFAWFTDSASTGVNRIQAGNLDVEVLHTNAKGVESLIKDETDLFLDNDGEPIVWEPGAVAYETFTVKNVGSLAFKYEMGLSINSYTTVNDRSLLEVLKVAIVEARPANRNDAIDYFNVSDNVKNINDAVRDNAVTGLLFGDASSNHLSSGSESQHSFTMIIYWPSDTDAHSALSDNGLTDNDFNMNNEKQGNVLDIEFKIQLTATQYTEENDSFNDQYDKDAIYALDPVTTVNKESEVASKTVNEDGSVSYTSGAAPTTRTDSQYVTSITFNSETAYGELNVNVDTTNTLFNIKRDQSEKVASLNITADKQGTPVHEFVNDEKALVNTYISTGLSNVTVEYLYEDRSPEIWGDGTDNYTNIDNLSVSNHGLYYNAVTGQLAFITTHFSEFSAKAMGAVAYTQNEDTDNAYITYEDAANASVGENAQEVRLPVNITQDEMKEAQQAAETVPGSSFSLTENQVNKNDDLTEQFFEARIGKQYYATLSSAVEDASTNDTIYLIKDLVVNNTISINKSIIINLNGFEIKMYGADGFVVMDSNLTLLDSSEEETGVINHLGNDDLAWAMSGGKVNIYSGTYKTTGKYGILYLSSEAESGIIGGKFNTSVVKCADGYDVELTDGWYIPQRYYMWKDYAAEQFSNINETAKIIEINSAEELALLAKNVNSGNTYNGYTVILNNDIDLSGKRWAPIGTSGKPFNGTFDGKGYTISNLIVYGTLDNNSSNNYHGLFGNLQYPAIVRDFTINNANVSGSLYVGAVAGMAHTGKEISNVKVIGDVKISGYWYVGGIAGNGYINTVSNCVVNANLGSFVKGTGSYIGGIYGFRGEGDQVIDSCTSNIDVEGYSYVGGISGMLHYGNTISNCVSSGTVTKTAPSDTTDSSDIYGIGGIAGIYVKHDTSISKIQNCSFEGALVSNSEIVNGGIIGFSRDGDQGLNLIVSGCNYLGTEVDIDTTTE